MGKSKHIESHNNDSSNNFQIGMHFGYVHEQLIKENVELKKQLENMTGQKEILEKLLSEKDKTIAELRKENEELKLRIQSLETQIIEIKKENAEIKKENVALKSNIIGIKDEFHTYKQKQLLKTVMIILQDINRHLKIENSSNEPLKTHMRNIHSSRIEMAHYINNNDTKNIKDYKCKFILTKINEIMSIKDLINKRAKSESFIDSMIEILKEKQISYTPTDEELEDIENWWFDNC